MIAYLILLVIQVATLKNMWKYSLVYSISHKNGPYCWYRLPYKLSVRNMARGTELPPFPLAPVCVLSKLASALPLQLSEDIQLSPPCSSRGLRWCTQYHDVDEDVDVKCTEVYRELVYRHPSCPSVKPQSRSGHLRQNLDISRQNLNISWRHLDFSWRNLDIFWRSGCDKCLDYQKADACFSRCCVLNCDRPWFRWLQSCVMTSYHLMCFLWRHSGRCDDNKIWKMCI